MQPLVLYNQISGGKNIQVRFVTEQSSQITFHHVVAVTNEGNVVKAPEGSSGAMLGGALAIIGIAMWVRHRF